MTRASKALLIFFWVAFGAFLAASIPHVAWFFSVFEPVNGPDGWMYWGVSYGIAISIDVTTFLLSMTVAGLAKQGKAKSLILSVWAFILALAFLSWWINGKYAIHFEQSGLIAPSPVVIPLGFTDLHINDLNPIIASCFQALAVAYTWISDKIANGEKPKTAAELREEADELEAISIQRARIASKKRENLRSSLSGAINAAKEIGGELRPLGGEKVDPDVEMLNRLAAFFRATPDILKDENAAQSETVIAKMLKLNVKKNGDVARVWRLKTLAALTEEREQDTPDDGQTSGQTSDDKLNLTVAFLLQYPHATEEELAQHLGLARPASALFWRAKASNLLGNFRHGTWENAEQAAANLEETSNESLIDLAHENGQNLGQDTDKTGAVNISDFFESPDRSSSSTSGQSANLIDGEQFKAPETGTMRSHGFTGGRYISLDDAAEMTGYAVDTLKRKANSGEIKYHLTDKTRLLYSSVKDLRNPKPGIRTAVLSVVSAD